MCLIHTQCRKHPRSCPGALQGQGSVPAEECPLPVLCFKALLLNRAVRSMVLLLRTASQSQLLHKDLFCKRNPSCSWIGGEYSVFLATSQSTASLSAWISLESSSRVSCLTHALRRDSRSSLYISNHGLKAKHLARRHILHNLYIL